MLDGMYVTKSISTGLYPNLDLWTTNKLQLQLQLQQLITEKAHKIPRVRHPIGYNKKYSIFPFSQISNSLNVTHKKLSSKATYHIGYIQNLHLIPILYSFNNLFYYNTTVNTMGSH